MKKFEEASFRCPRCKLLMAWSKANSNTDLTTVAVHVFTHKDENPNCPIEQIDFVERKEWYHESIQALGQS